MDRGGESRPGTVWTIILLKGTAQAHSLQGIRELPPCSISFWRPENLEQVRFTEALAIITTQNPEHAPCPALAEPLILDGLSCEVIIDTFINNHRPGSHQSAALNLVCHQTANLTESNTDESAPLSARAEGEEPSGKDETLSAEVSRYMESHMDESMTLADLAEAFNCTPAQISAAFRCEQNTSPMKVLAAHRLKQARRLLQNSDLPVTQIGTAVGYSDHASFTHFFKRHTSMSPREFRENHRWLL